MQIAQNTREKRQTLTLSYQFTIRGTHNSPPTNLERLIYLSSILYLFLWKIHYHQAATVHVSPIESHHV